ncbi:bifunctional ADP-dependent NAD(P)H-hydrate dehydratase/NAD(P)H-hydrate epimerase [Rhodococcus aerolatus]
MRHAHEVEAVRAAEESVMAGLADPDALMRRAAWGLAGVVTAELRARCGAVSGTRVVLLVGAGGNGGDALWAGAFLRERGVAVTAVLLVPDRAHATGLAALRRAGGRTVTEDGAAAVVPGADLVVDGVVGLSGRGGLREGPAAVAALVDAPVVAVDLPSGVDADSGAVGEPALRADVTVALGELKNVHLLAPVWCGRVEVVDLHLPLGPSRVTAWDRADVAAAWPVPGPEDDKYSQGVVGVAAGSATYPGAAVLCTGAATAATSGMVRYAGTAKDAVLAHRPEVVATEHVEDAGRVQAWVAGPGIGTDDEALGLVRHVLGAGVPCLLDADATTVLAHHPDLLDGHDHPVLLTPHAEEFARLTGAEPGDDRLTAVRRAADALGATVLLKGRATVVAEPGGRAVVNDAGSSWSSTAGSGDLLSGVLGALLAAGLTPLDAAAAGTHVHALAAALAARGAPVSASTVLAHLRPAVRLVRTGSAA